MTKIIKNFSEFHKIDEGYGDILGELVSSGSTALTDVIKNKVISYLLEFFGANPDSLLGNIIRNFAETIYVSDLYDWIIKGQGDISVRTLAPRLADVTMETLSDLGVDGIADRLKITDKKGWVYSTIREMISNSAKKEEFRDHILSFWTWVLTAMAGGESKSLFGTVKNNKKSPLQIMKDPEVQKAAEKSGVDIASILRNLSTGATNPSGQMTTVGGQ
jgi:hypothetical protein